MFRKKLLEVKVETGVGTSLKASGPPHTPVAYLFCYPDLQLHKYLFRFCRNHPLGMESPIKRNFIVSQAIRPKEAQPHYVITADFGGRNVQLLPHQNRLCFSLLLSFAEAKESRG